MKLPRLPSGWKLCIFVGFEAKHLQIFMFKTQFPTRVVRSANKYVKNDKVVICRIRVYVGPPSATMGQYQNWHWLQVVVFRHVSRCTPRLVVQVVQSPAIFSHVVQVGSVELRIVVADVIPTCKRKRASSISELTLMLRNYFQLLFVIGAGNRVSNFSFKWRKIIIHVFRNPGRECGTPDCGSRCHSNLHRKRASSSSRVTLMLRDYFQLFFVIWSWKLRKQFQLQMTKNNYTCI